MLKKENSLVFVVLPPMEAVFFVDLVFHHRHCWQACHYCSHCCCRCLVVECSSFACQIQIRRPSTATSPTRPAGTILLHGMESCLSVLLLLLATNSILYQNTAKSRMNGMMAWNRWQENLKTSSQISSALGFLTSLTQALSSGPNTLPNNDKTFLKATNLQLEE